MNRVLCSTQGEYLFTRCVFFGDPNNLIEGDGGAIYLENNSATLTVDSCQFYSLAVTSCCGAISTDNLPKVNITNSLFNSCSAAVYPYGGVGAVLIIHCSQPLIQDCLFTSCTSFGDGGAVYLYYGYCSWNNGIAVQNSRFVSCKCTGESTGDGADGGGLMTYANEQLIGIHNCLFSHCYCYKGAGIYLYLPDIRQLTPIQFCFFTHNSGTYGNDVFVHYRSTFRWSIIFSHCFTAGSAHTLGENGNSPSHVDNNWLPQANVNATLTSTINGYRHNAIHSDRNNDNDSISD